MAKLGGRLGENPGGVDEKTKGASLPWPRKLFMKAVDFVAVMLHFGNCNMNANRTQPQACTPSQTQQLFVGGPFQPIS